MNYYILLLFAQICWFVSGSAGVIKMHWIVSRCGFNPNVTPVYDHFVMETTVQFLPPKIRGVLFSNRPDRYSSIIIIVSCPGIMIPIDHILSALKTYWNHQHRLVSGFLFWLYCGQVPDLWIRVPGLPSLPTHGSRKSNGFSTHLQQMVTINLVFLSARWLGFSWE